MCVVILGREFGAGAVSPIQSHFPFSHVTSSHGSPFRITGPLWGEFSGEFHSQSASNADVGIS